jgi:hypothetical protein
MINPESPEMQDLKKKVDIQFYPNIYMLFDRLGEIDPSITSQYQKSLYRESIYFISYKSLLKNLPNVFKIKNQMFAKMLFLFLSDRAPLNARISYQQFLEKLMPFWHKNKEAILLERN